MLLNLNVADIYYNNLSVIIVFTKQLYRFFVLIDTMKIKAFFLITLFLYCHSLFSQGYKTLSIQPNKEFYDIQFKIHKHKQGSKEILHRDFVSFHLMTMTENDSILKSSFDKEPFIKEISIEEPRYITEGFLKYALLELHVGDSATFLINADDIYRSIKKPMPSFIHSGSKLKYVIKVLKRENYLQVQNNAKQKIFDQHKKEEKVIAKYMMKNLPNAKRTYNGLWYKIEEQGDSIFAVKDDVVAVEFTGKFLDGTVFNSTEIMGHELHFPVGQNFVIKAFDEIMLLLKKGAKVKFIAPSKLCYGHEGWGKTIPPDTPLYFELEFKDILLRKIVIESIGEIKQEEKAKKVKELTEEEKIKKLEKDFKKRTNYKGN